MAPHCGHLVCSSILEPETLKQNQSGQNQCQKRRRPSTGILLTSYFGGFFGHHGVPTGTIGRLTHGKAGLVHGWGRPWIASDNLDFPTRDLGRAIGIDNRDIPRAWIGVGLNVEIPRQSRPEWVDRITG